MTSFSSNDTAKTRSETLTNFANEIFLIGAHELLMEDLNSSTMLWRTLQALLSIYVQTL